MAIVTTPIPLFFAFSIAISIACGAITIPSPLSQSIFAMESLSLVIFQFGAGFITPSFIFCMYTRNIFDTPWLSTPRRSALNKQSVPILASCSGIPALLNNASTVFLSRLASTLTESSSPTWNTSNTMITSFEYVLIL